MTDENTAPRPLVGIVMGSDSDYPVMRAAEEALAEFGIEVEVDVVSAHRMPEDMVAYGRGAAERGLRVLIAGAGGAAHLPGMLASLTPLPSREKKKKEKKRTKKKDKKRRSGRQ
jgi:5-(carboxyamino)imidazole ribonucleotide mutase